MNRIKLITTSNIKIAIAILVIVYVVIILKTFFHNYYLSRKEPILNNCIEFSEPNSVVKHYPIPESEFFKSPESNSSDLLNMQNELNELPLDPRATPEYVKAVERVPIHPWHTERIENIRNENIEQLVENIANFDDLHFAFSSISTGYSEGTMEHEVTYVINLFRVRRLFEEGLNNSKQIVPILQQAYQQIHKSWPDARSDRLKKAPTGRITLTYPDLYLKHVTGAVSMTYLLGELGDTDSLKVLFEGYKKQCDWIQEYGVEKSIATPVPTPMTLYAIHRLAVTLPENKMDIKTFTARKAYLEWAKKYVQEPEIVKVTAWNSDYDESDPYLRIVDPKGEVLAGQPSIYIPKYPYKLLDGTYFWKGRLEDEKQKEKEWADHLIPFVDAVLQQNALERN